MILTVVSHTEHYIENGETKGWGPTVRELDHLTEVFDHIYHIAFLHEGQAPASALSYQSKQITFVPIKAVQGGKWKRRFKGVLLGFQMIPILKMYLNKSDVYQFRAPAGIGVILIPYLIWFSNKMGWYKYAGNWIQKKAPFSYSWQRKILRDFQNRPVTINGKWPGQKEHLISFENPCLTDAEVKEGDQTLKKKNYNFPIKACFVGRLEDPKGVSRILDFLEDLASSTWVSEFHFVGDGPGREHYEKRAKDWEHINVVFHHWLPKMEVNKLFSECQALLLPSTASEGFPKVIAEAANYGCVPVVSNVSSVGQYVTEFSGISWPIQSGVPFGHFIKTEFRKLKSLESLAIEARKFALQFTYKRYNKRIQEEILPKITPNKSS